MTQSTPSSQSSLRVPRRVATLAGVLMAAGALAACGGGGGTTAAPVTVTVPATTVTAAPIATTATAAPAAAAPAKVAIPNLKGQNGAIAQDELKRLGFTNVRLAADAASGKSTVLLPENWTVTKVEPNAGTQVSTDQLVVVTMTK